jgi:hypothetical protein
VVPVTLQTFSPAYCGLTVSQPTTGAAINAAMNNARPTRRNGTRERIGSSSRTGGCLWKGPLLKARRSWQSRPSVRHACKSVLRPAVRPIPVPTSCQSSNFAKQSKHSIRRKCAPSGLIPRRVWSGEVSPLARPQALSRSSRMSVPALGELKENKLYGDKDVKRSSDRE